MTLAAFVRWAFFPSFFRPVPVGCSETGALGLTKRLIMATLKRPKSLLESASLLRCRSFSLDAIIRLTLVRVTTQKQGIPRRIPQAT